MKDTRKSARVDAQLFISYDVIDESGRVTYSGMALSRDLSRKGVLIEERMSFPVDSKVQMHLGVGEDVVHVDGHIRHIEEVSENMFHIGIEFQQLSTETLNALSQFYPEIK
jgi:hypothetical protein